MKWTHSNKEQYSTAFINVTNGLLLLSITISFQQSCLKMAVLKYLHKAILKLHAQVIDIVCVLSHFICCYFRTLHYYLIKKYKKCKWHTVQKRSAASRRSHWYHTHTPDASRSIQATVQNGLFNHQTDISLLQEWTMWHKWVWSLVFKKNRANGKRKRDLLQLSIWSIQTVLESQKDKRFAEKCTIHNLSSRVKSLYLSQIIVNVHNVI